MALAETGLGSPQRVSVSVDVEEDILLYLTGSRLGLEQGLPNLLGLFEGLQIRADLFVQGDLVPTLEESIRDAGQRGHRIGLHGARHQGTWLHPAVEEKGLRRAAQNLARISGRTPGTHRVPNFRLKERHLAALERTGLLLDSSILPNARYVRLHGRLLLRSYDGAPRRPYHPSRHDVTVPGDSAILEVPVTENPDFPRAPLGLGYLNTFGLEATRAAFAKIREPYVTFLIHTWEAVDLGARYPELPHYVRRECSGDLEPLAQFLGALRDRFTFAQLEEIGSTLQPAGGGQ